MDIEQARFNMIEQQIRPWEVVDKRVLDMIAKTPRECFVPDDYKHLAFSDINVPIGHDQVMMTPKVEARMLQALDIQSDDHILEIGTGSGYVTALLAQLGGHVTTEEIFSDLSEQAENRLRLMEIDNVEFIVGDSLKSRPFYNRYDVIAVTGSLPQMDSLFKEQLEFDGRLFIIVGEAPIMEAWLITRLSEYEWEKKSLFDTSIPPLIGAEPKHRFTI